MRFVQALDVIAQFSHFFAGGKLAERL
jgi:hypothetical protein